MSYYRRNEDDLRKDSIKAREEKRDWDEEKEWDDKKEWDDEEEEVRRPPKKEQKKPDCYFEEKKCRVECPFKIVVTLVPIKDHHKDDKYCD